MRFDRKIRYFDYRQNGEKLHGAGFVRLEQRDDRCSISVQISGLHETDTFSRQVYLEGDDREVVLCTVNLQGGRGAFQLDLPVGNLCGGMHYDEVRAIRIPLTAGRELYCKIMEKETSVRETTSKEEMQVEGETINIKEIMREPYVEKPDWKSYAKEPDSTLHAKKPDEKFYAKELDLIPHVEEADRKSLMEEADTTPDVEKSDRKPSVEESDFTAHEEVTEFSAPPHIEAKKVLKEKEKIKAEEIEPARSQAMLRGHGKSKEQWHMQENKWKQLTAIYPHIAPFRDEREYLRLSPEDFVILDSKFYHLVHNSFLLHGYYNYNHLILWRQEQRGNVRYYIGVPGNFFEREKQVALMFGFESFECQTEPANAGDYGYYMIRVEL